jgi:hypothetical protein
LQARHNEGFDIYYSHATLLRDLSDDYPKASGKDIKEMIGRHVDVDPRAGEDLTAEKQRIKGLFSRTGQMLGIEAPTALIYSGGGYQAIYQWTTRITINGDPALLEEYKHYNLHLEQQFGGDNCHDLTRILRLPGTVNQKRTKGRQPTLATLVQWNDVSYGPARSPKAEPVNKAAAAPLAVGAPEQVNLDDLGLPEDLLKLVREGKQRHHKSRSEAEFQVCCGLLKHGVSPERVLGILLDPALGVSESIREKRNAEKYARRQIERAKEAIENQFDMKWIGTGEKARQVPAANLKNVRVALNRLGVKVSQDIFSGLSMIEGLPGYGPYLTDPAVDELQALAEQRYELSMKPSTFFQGISVYAWRNKFHPVLDYFDGLKWDGVKRIGDPNDETPGWLSVYGGAPNTELNRATMRLMMVAAVRRCRQPGCKFDEVMVLEQPTQGTEKSTALKVLAIRPEWFTDGLSMNMSAKEMVEQLKGKLIAEYPELDGLKPNKAASIKATLSRSTDRARLSYGRLASDHPRQNVFYGTVNLKKYLSDPTGNRRVWPMPIVRFDIMALERDLDQLWAEAVAIEATGESIRLDEKYWKLAQAEQEKRLLPDPWAEALSAAIGNLQGVFLGDDLWRVCGIEKVEEKERHGQAFNNAVTKLGLERKKLRWPGYKHPQWSYYRGNIDVRNTYRKENERPFFTQPEPKQTVMPFPRDGVPF